MCSSPCSSSASSSSRSASSSTVWICIISSRSRSDLPATRRIRSRRTAEVEFLLLLGCPLAGALALGALGARRWAPELNVAVSLATFLAACALTARVIGEGNLLVAREQFFIDPFNVFLVTLTAFVCLTTSLFSLPYIPAHLDHPLSTPPHSRPYPPITT